MESCLQRPGRKFPQMELRLQEGILQGLCEIRGAAGLEVLGENTLEWPQAEVATDLVVSSK